VTPEDAADGIRVLLLDRRDVEAELDAGPAPRHPDDLAAERLLGELLAVLGRREGDARVGVQVVDVVRVDEPVHERVDRRRRAAGTEGAVGERLDHLVLVVESAVDVLQRAHAVEPQHGEALLGERAEVAAGALDPQQLDVLARDRVGRAALRRRIAACVVGVGGIGPQPVAAGDEVGDGGHGSCPGLFDSVICIRSSQAR